MMAVGNDVDLALGQATIVGIDDDDTPVGDDLVHRIAYNAQRKKVSALDRARDCDCLARLADLIRQLAGGDRA